MVRSPQKLYQCPECKLHYADPKIAKKCQAWCSRHQSCNLEYLELSVEAKRAAKIRGN